MTRDRAPGARVLHAMHDRAVAARRLAEAAAVLARRERAELLVDERHELARQIVRVAADRGRIDVLIAAERGEAIGERDDHRPHLALVHEPRGALGHVLLEAARRGVHPAGARETDEIVDDGEARAAAAALRLVVLRRQPEVEQPHVRIAERVVGEHARGVLESYEPAGGPVRSLDGHETPYLNESARWPASSRAPTHGRRRDPTRPDLATTRRARDR